MKNTRWILLTVVASGLALISAVGLVKKQPETYRYCKICAAEEITNSWGLSMSSGILYTRNEVVETPFSKLVRDKKLAPTHSHEWLAPKEIPDPVNEFGPHVVESLDNISAPRVVSFMRNVSDYADPAQVAHLKQVVIDPAYSYVIDKALVHEVFPEKGFPNQKSFQKWMDKRCASFENELRWLTIAD